MRCFVAVDVGINENISSLLGNLKHIGKVVEGENLHITLKFLGEIESSTKIEEALSQIIFPRFKLVLKGLGAFPTLKRSRILFINAIPVENISALASEVDAKTKEIHQDNPFHPHVTILRLKVQKDLSSLASMYESTVFAEQEITSFRLYRSTLTSRGPIYSVIRSFQLI
ncbi:MAG: RNA 2',3'-cyclic phosphodiesterase [Thermoplasmatales archaeon]